MRIKVDESANSHVTLFKRVDESFLLTLSDSRFRLVWVERKKENHTMSGQLFKYFPSILVNKFILQATICFFLPPLQSLRRHSYQMTATLNCRWTRRIGVSVRVDLFGLGLAKRKLYWCTPAGSLGEGIQNTFFLTSLPVRLDLLLTLVQVRFLFYVLT